MKLILKHQLQTIDPIRKATKQKVNVPATCFFIAGVACSINYFFQYMQASEKNQHQKDVIDRVSKEQKGINFLQNFDAQKAEEWEGKRVTLNGVLKDGRFVVKRNRGNEEGYMILAPFVVQRSNDMQRQRHNQRKFVVNIGWVPKKSKHLIKTLTTYDIIGENDYTGERVKALEQQKVDKLLRDPIFIDNVVPVTTIDAVIRTGQKKDPLNGLNNWPEDNLFKFIDLNFLCPIMRIVNDREGSQIYFERLARDQDETEVIPLPSSKQTIIEDMKEKIAHNNNTKVNTINTFNLSAFGLATLASFVI